jgi:hypothetical protein
MPTILQGKLGGVARDESREASSVSTVSKVQHEAPVLSPLLLVALRFDGDLVSAPSLLPATETQLSKVTHFSIGASQSPAV